MKRDSLSHEGLLNELRLEPVDYFNYLRMDEQTYSELLSLLTPLIKRQDTVMRKAISPHERLTATLRFLATGRSYEDLKFSTSISPQAFYFPQTRKTSIQFYHFTQKFSTKFICHIRRNAPENKQQINEIIKYIFQLNTCSRFPLVKTEQR